MLCELEHGGDCKAAVKAAAELLGLRHKGAEDLPDPTVNIPEGEAGDSKPKEPPPFTRLLTSPELLALNLNPQFLIRGVMVQGQPMIMGGRSKAMKTSIAVDLVVSLGTGSPFLGRFDVARQVAVGYWSGESGAATIRETAKRVAESKRTRDDKPVNLADSDCLWCFDLPRLSDLAHLDSMEEVIRHHGLRVAVIDPLYLALLSPETASGASNVFMMGSLLQGLTRLGQRTNCTIALLHHFRKGGQPDEDNPAGLEELAQSGVAEGLVNGSCFNGEARIRATGFIPSGFAAAVPRAILACGASTSTKGSSTPTRSPGGGGKSLSTRRPMPARKPSGTGSNARRPNKRSGRGNTASGC